jgi:hypothetical protein
MKMIKQNSNQVKRIIILAANPTTTPRLRLDKEVGEINRGIQRSRYREQFEIHMRLAVGIRDLRQALLDVEPHIVHFTGHGNEDGLLVEDELGMAVHISEEALSGLFKLFSKQVECVILSSCYSAPQAAAICKHIDYVIGMEKDIEDKAAIEFSAGFYDALGAGKSVEEAFEFGCNGIRLKFPDTLEHLIPVLKKREGVEILDSGPDLLITKREKEMVNIQVNLERTGDIFDLQVSKDARTSEVKNRLVSKLKLPQFCEDGQPVIYYLHSKTRKKTMDDDKTLRENGVQSNEIFVFLQEIDEGGM